MKSITSINGINIDYIENMKELINLSASKYSEKPAVKYIEGNQVLTKSFLALKDDVSRLANKLLSSKYELANIVLLADVSYRWIVAFYGIVSAGMTVVPMDTKLNDENIIDLIKRVKADAVFYEKKYKKHIDKMQEALKDIRFTICIDDHEDCIKLPEESIKQGNANEYNNVIISGDMTAVIVFTSGTTGVSKGVILSHRNLCDNLLCSYYLVGNGDYSATIPLLPVNHTFELTTGIQCPIYVGATICIGKGIRYFEQSLILFKPSILILVPQAVEMLSKRIWMKARAEKRDKKLKFALFLSRMLLLVGIDVRKKLFKEIHNTFGGNLNTIVCGGAHLGSNLVKEFDAFGINLLNGYGITECSPVVSCNMIGDKKLNSVGRLAPCEYCQVRIVNGEIQVAGSIVMKGYYNDFESNKKAFEGKWFKTGDMGHIDRKGFLYITGRKKNLIILDNGENVSPEELEEHIKPLDIVDEVIVHSEHINDIIAICATIVPNYDYIEQHGVQNIEKYINNEINVINKTLPNYKRIQHIKIRQNEFEKTTTGKIKRNKTI